MPNILTRPSSKLSTTRAGPITLNTIIIDRSMQQQLIEQTIDITPASMADTLAKITHLLAQSPLSERLLPNIVKSLFYGLWNFDKMINQHTLSTNIAGILAKVPKKNAYAFLAAILGYLTEKWNFIDHHRINKFMQLVRYLVRQGLKLSQKRTDQVLMDTVFNNVQERSGIADHITQLYFDTICEVTLNKAEPEAEYSTTLPANKLDIFMRLLMNPLSLEYFRLHVIEQVYEKYKAHIINVDIASNEGQALQKIEAFNANVLELAKNVENDSVRKNMYTLIGFMKSDHDLFSSYLQEKRQKLLEQREIRKKKISKGKKQMIKQAKAKNKQKRQKNKKGKTISRSNFEFKAREQEQKMTD